LDAQVRNNPGRVVQITDYLVVTTYDHGGRDPAGHSGPVQLPESVRIGRLDYELAERLFSATTLRGENWEPTRQFHAVHAYVRDVWMEDAGDPPDDLHRWDHEGRIWPVVQLSRLVRDNNASTEHAARRLLQADGGEQLVPFDGYGSHVVYRLYPDREGWLDVGEADELRALVQAFWNNEPILPDRVKRALHRADAITGERYLEDAMPLVVGAFESLAKIGRSFLTAQFSQRVPKMAGEVGVQLSVPECAEVYEDRSALVHGAGVDLSKQHDQDEFGRRFNALQEALRRIVRRAIEDREFAAIFASDASITARWPAVVKVRQRRRSWRMGRSIRKEVDKTI
jgi:hypothetical protein